MYYPLMCSFDLETTGVDVTKDKIVTASCIDINSETGETKDNTWLVNPGIDIPTGASDVHGITTEVAREQGMDHDTALWEIINHIYAMWDMGAVLIVFNAAYDISMLNVLSGGKFEIKGPIIDPLVIDKGVDPYRKGPRKLVNMSEYYGVPLSEEDAHDSTADCYAAARIAWVMMSRGVLDSIHSVEQLMEQQSQWKNEQFESLKQWLLGQGKIIDGDGGWPIQHQAKI